MNNVSRSFLHGGLHLRCRIITFGLFKNVQTSRLLGRTAFPSSSSHFAFEDSRPTGEFSRRFCSRSFWSELSGFPGKRAFLVPSQEQLVERELTPATALICSPPRRSFECRCSGENREWSSGAWCRVDFTWISRTLNQISSIWLHSDTSTASIFTLLFKVVAHSSRRSLHLNVLYNQLLWTTQFTN